MNRAYLQGGPQLVPWQREMGGGTASTDREYPPFRCDLPVRADDLDAVLANPVGRDGDRAGDPGGSQGADTCQPVSVIGSEWIS